MAKNNKPYIRGFISVLLCFYSLITFGQTTKNSVFDNSIIEFKGNYGFFLSYQERIDFLMQKHFASFEISYAKESYGKRLWEQTYNYPIIGFAYWHSNFGGSDFIGHGDGVFPFLNFPFNKNKTFHHNLRMGFGIGWLSKAYERTDNYKNIFIGTHLNHCANLEYELRFKINRITLTTGLGLTHFSNGTIKKPNLGINILSAHLGVAYMIKKNKHDHIINGWPKDSIIKNAVTFFARYGVTDLDVNDKTYYSIYDISANYFKTLGHKSRIGAGLDIFYNTADFTRIARKNIQVKNKFDILKPGINFGHELMLSKFSFIFQMGIYIYEKDKTMGLFYHRIAWTYCVNKHLLLNISLKTHFARAEDIEWGLGYKL